MTEPSCPYKCISDKYRKPNCYTPLEELIYTFGGPWLFAALFSFILVLLALLVNTLRTKFVGSGSYNSARSIEHHSRHHFPYLLSLSEVYYLVCGLHIYMYVHMYRRISINQQCALLMGPSGTVLSFAAHFPPFKIIGARNQIRRSSKPCPSDVLYGS